ncbi:MipA/OmpV family protein [Pseudomonas lundensis]|uniref:MipA/OmpV family protein n=1 Tax=Serratia proteamaculans TaxID=28151 RepID=UPI002980A960|nr:MipA/OmpV family protein [Serratia proteamaculans]MDW5502143.1 MipA/OmpV family protein [Serratia proteamaculans]MDW5507202.1 MipA/OmpV family protein [Pseudomonas lundensis]
MKSLSVTALSCLKGKNANTLFLLACTIYSPWLSAASWSIGGAAAVSDYGYRDTKAQTQGMPTVDYEDDNFYLHTLTAGYYLLKTPKDRLSIMALYSPLGFDPDDSDNDQMKKLDKRKGTLMAGLNYYHSEEWGTFRATLLGDTLGNSKGMVGDLAFMYPIDFGKLQVVPAMGVVWSSRKQNDYYYGVSSAEADRSGFSTYSPGASWDPYVELVANYQFTENWYAAAVLRVSKLSSKISDSPIMDKEVSGAALIGGGYRF